VSVSDYATEFLVDDFSGRQEELCLFMVQFMAVFFAKTTQRRMIGWLVNNETETSVPARHCLKAAKNSTTKNLRS
jgi:hypothetical protein